MPVLLTQLRASSMSTPAKPRIGATEPTPSTPRWGGMLGGQGRDPTRMPPRRVWLWFAIALLANFLITRSLVPGPEAPLVIPYTVFKEQVAKHNVHSVYSRGDTLMG